MTPNPVSGRFVIIFVLFLSVTIYDYYTSVFVSALIKSGSKNKIKTIQQLADSEFELGFEEIPYIHSFLQVTYSLKKSSTIAIYQKKSNQLIQNHERWIKVHVFVTNPVSDDQRSRHPISNIKENRPRLTARRPVHISHRWHQTHAKPTLCIPLWCKHRVPDNGSPVHAMANMRLQCHSATTR